MGQWGALFDPAFLWQFGELFRDADMHQDWGGGWDILYYLHTH